MKTVTMTGFAMVLVGVGAVYTVANADTGKGLEQQPVQSMDNQASQIQGRGESTLETQRRLGLDSQSMQRERMKKKEMQRQRQKQRSGQASGGGNEAGASGTGGRGWGGQGAGSSSAAGSSGRQGGGRR